MQNIQAVLFDLDDTLWPIVPVIERAEQTMHNWLHEHAPAVARHFSIQMLRQRRQELMLTDPVYQLDLNALRRAGLREAFHQTGDDPSLIDRAMHVFSTARNQVVLFSDVLPGLRGLRNDFRLGTISNGMSNLEKIGLSEFFEVSLAAHHFGCAKPDPAIFLAACKALGISPEQAVYVGDDPLMDVVGAQRAGLRAVWLKRRELSTRDLPLGTEPDGVCSCLFELQEWLKKTS